MRQTFESLVKFRSKPVKTALFWTIIVPIILVSLVFLVSNRTFVSLDLWPFPVELNTPLSIVILLSVFLGFLAGGVTAWVSASEARRKARVNVRRVKILERELDRSSITHEEAATLSEESVALQAFPPPASRNEA